MFWSLRGLVAWSESGPANQSFRVVIKVLGWLQMLPPMVEIFQWRERNLLGDSLLAWSVMISVQSSAVLLVVRMPFVLLRMRRLSMNWMGMSSNTSTSVNWM